PPAPPALPALPALSVYERLQLLQQELQNIFLRQDVGRAQGALGLDDAAAAIAAGVSDDLRHIAAWIERQLEVVLSAAVRDEPDAARRREHVERVPIRSQRAGNLLEERDRDRRQERVERARGLIRAGTAFRGLA